MPPISTLPRGVKPDDHFINPASPDDAVRPRLTRAAANRARVTLSLRSNDVRTLEPTANCIVPDALNDVPLIKSANGMSSLPG